MHKNKPAKETSLMPCFVISDQKAPSEPCQAADERLHGVVSAGAEENCGDDPRQTQRGDLEGAGPTVEAAQRGPAPAVHHRG